MLEAIFCISLAVYFEARDQPDLGQLAVAYTIINRVERPRRFPDAHCEVVYEPYQYTFYWDGKPEIIRNPEAHAKAWAISAMAYFKLLPDPTHGSTHYHKKSHRVWWSRGHSPVVRIKDHEFYNTVK